jgi:hypothetical protein
MPAGDVWTKSAKLDRPPASPTKQGDAFLWADHHHPKQSRRLTLSGKYYIITILLEILLTDGQPSLQNKHQQHPLHSMSLGHLINLIAMSGPLEIPSQAEPWQRDFDRLVAHKKVVIQKINGVKAYCLPAKKPRKPTRKRSSLKKRCSAKRPKRLPA